MFFKNWKKLTAIPLALSIALTSIPMTSVFGASSNITLSSNIEDFKQEVPTYNSVGYGKDDVKLSWKEATFAYSDGTEPETRYYIARKKVNTDDLTDYGWELRGNYETEEIKVLNIYPKVGNGLQSWMEALKKDYPDVDLNISTSQVSLETFNKRPQEYLWKNSDGTYNYDVIVFGFWDSNNYLDLSKSTDPQNYPVSAYTYIQEYIDAGYGVIFGHDTAQEVDKHRNFAKILEDNSSFEVLPNDDKSWTYSDKISVQQQSTITTYPFDIVNDDLIIPMSHTVNQYPTDSSNVYMTFEKNYYPTPSDGPYFNYNIRGTKDKTSYTYGGKTYQSNVYLMVDGNVAFIQCGHSSGKTNTAEQKVLANTIYALTQMTTSTTAMDRIMDENKPYPPIPELADSTDVALTFSAEDKGTQYKYRIIAEPVGYGDSVSKHWDTIKKQLDSSNAPFTLSNVNGGSNMYAISDMVTTFEELAQIKGSLSTEIDKKAYEYYVDTNPVGERRDKDSGTEFLYYGDAYKIKSIAEGLGQGQYLHLWSYDNSNNISVNNTNRDVATATSPKGLNYSIINGITNISLWDATPSYDSTVKYTDMAGIPIGTGSLTTVEKLGSTYEPGIPYIENYRYNSSVPNKSLVVDMDTSKNEITHKYDKIISKDIYTVKHDKNGNVTETVKINTITGKATDIFTLTAPNINNYNYLGYNSNPTSSVGALLTPTEVQITDETPLYLHYDVKTGTFKIQVKRSDSDVVLSEFTNNGAEYVAGENVAVLGDVILAEYIKDVNAVYDFSSSVISASLTSGSAVTFLGTTDPIDDSSCYANGKELSKNRQGVIKEGENVLTITLVPKSLKVVDYGITNTGKKIEILGNEPYTYQVGKLYENVNRKNYSGWNPADPDVILKTLDFTDSKPYYTFVYYPEGSTIPNLTYTVYFYNLGEKDASGKYTQITGSVIVSSLDDNLAAPVFKDVPIGDDLVDFELEDMDVVEDKDIINLYYRPYSTIDVKEYITKTDATDSNYSTSAELVADNIYYELFGNKITLETFITEENKDEYEVIAVEKDNVLITGNINLDELLATNEYSRDLEVYYRPKTYDLTVNVVDNAEKLNTRKYAAYTFRDVAIKDEIQFMVPKELDGYTLIDATIGENTLPEYFNKVDNGDKYQITFNPILTEGSYTLELVYGMPTKATVTYALLTRGVLEFKGSATTEDVYIGDVFKYTVPDLSEDGFKARHAYLDGKLYTPIENDVYNIPISKANQHLYMIYEAVPQYKVSTNVLPSGTGTVTGNISSDSLFAVDDKVSLSAIANEGYVFDYWTVNSGELDLGTQKYSSELYFSMPSSDVSLTANFIDEDDYVTPDGYYTLKVTSTVGGDATGSGLFKPNTVVNISAVPNTGYTFSGWVFERQNGAVLADSTAQNTTLTMPSGNVTVQAVFTSNGGSGGGNGGGDETEKPEKPEKPNKPNKPTEPTKPIIPFIPNIPGIDELPDTLE